MIPWNDDDKIVSFKVMLRPFKALQTVIPKMAELLHSPDVRLLLIADTHVPKRARDLPARVWDEVARADVVIHAGDWVEPPLLDALEARARRLVACWGNNDGDELRSRLPERADATLGGVRFTVVHETGAVHRPRGADGRRIPTPTCWSSATATSRGTPPRKPACDC